MLACDLIKLWYSVGLSFVAVAERRLSLIKEYSIRKLIIKDLRSVRTNFVPLFF